ncbi:MAG: HAD-IC family P-type ATPase [Vulcanimicrobiaceae bacterium]
MTTQRATSGSTDPAPSGLTGIQAKEALARDGPNEIAAIRVHPVLDFLRKFWSPIPWLLEGTILLTIATGRDKDAAAIAFLLLFNVVLAFFQERRAQRAVALLRAALVVHAKVLRDGIWSTISSHDVVMGDIVRLVVGDMIPADIHIIGGDVQVDQAVLTGESVPRDAGAAETIYAGSTIRRGDATGIVVATGARTRFGKTAELVRDVRAVGSVERLVFGIVRSLAIASGAVVLLVGTSALAMHVAVPEILTFALVVVLASIPVALPTAFTLATALGSLELARSGVLVTHLTAIEDAAAMDVLCTDKTGTLTDNHISVADVRACAPYNRTDVLRFAAAASQTSGQDPIDLAVIAAMAASPEPGAALTVEQFVPFDPQTKRAKATVRLSDGTVVLVAKGAPAALGVAFAGADTFASAGYRVIGVTVTSGAQTLPVGLLGLADPPRSDAAALIADIRSRGVEVRMLTGDGRETALHVAAQIGIPPESVDASVYPEQKLQIVQREQAAGHIVGMTGDGVNDAPSLKAANVGIAVSNATDVAKAAASIILTQPGLANMRNAIDSSRRIYQRMLTYVVAKIVKYFEIVFVTSVAFFIFGHFVLSATLMVALLVFNDFVTLSLSTDRVAPSRGFDAWKVGRLVTASAVIAIFTSAAILALLVFERAAAHLDIAALRGLAFLVLACMGQVAILALRERDSIFHERPSTFLIGTAAFAIAGASLMALRGILMPPLPPVVIAQTLIAILIWGLLLLVMKLPIYRVFGVGRDSSPISTPRVATPETKG